MALIDCLHRGNLMPKDYTINKYWLQFEAYMNGTKQVACLTIGSASI